MKKRMPLCSARGKGSLLQIKEEVRERRRSVRKASN